MNFLKWINSFFKEVSYQENIEAYVLSKHPKSAAEIELWIRHYNHHSAGRNFI
jgi:hypothetical protein